MLKPMITIDCREVESIKNELVVYVSDQIGAIPSLKIHEFMLSPVNDGDLIDKHKVIASIKEFLDSIGEARNFAVISKNDIISIKSLYGKEIKRESRPTEQMFSCSHCGHVTPYEVEHYTHMKIHYM